MSTKYLNAFLFSVLSLIQLTAQTSDQQEIQSVIDQAYVQGIHNGGPIEDIRAGFHPTFQMFRFNNNDVITTSIDQWIASQESYRQKNPGPPKHKSHAEYVSTQVSGNSASVVLNLMRENKTIFTDHLLLYKFSEGWRIVGKSFYRHPEK